MRKFHTDEIPESKPIREETESLMEMLSDYILLQEAEARMSAYDPAESRTQQEMTDELGITDEELADVDVEIE